MNALSVYGAGAVFASTSSSVGRAEPCAPYDEATKLAGRDSGPDESISSSDSESDEEEVGESSGVTLGVEVQKKKEGCNDKVFFFSIALWDDIDLELLFPFP